MIRDGWPEIRHRLKPVSDSGSTLKRTGWVTRFSGFWLAAWRFNARWSAAVRCVMRCHRLKPVSDSGSTLKRTGWVTRFSGFWLAAWRFNARWSALRGRGWRHGVARLIVALGLFLLAPLQPALAHDGVANADAILNAVGFDQRLDAQVPLALPFRDESGQAAPLGSYLRDRPVVLALTYYHCPNLCPLVLDGMAKSFDKLAFTVGEDFDVITVSIDPTETPAMATEAKATYLANYDRAGAATGWHFLTGDHAAVDTLATAVGFRFAYDAEQAQYAHAAGLILLTPEGKIARYLFGLDYAPQDLRLGLVEAGAGKIGSPIDQILLRCYHYDPVTGKYGIVVARVMQVAGIATVLMLGGLVGALIYQEKFVA